MISERANGLSVHPLGAACYMDTHRVCSLARWDSEFEWWLFSLTHS